MKKILLFIAGAMIIFTSCSQEDESNDLLKSSSEKTVKTEVTVILKTEKDIRKGYIVKAFHEAFDPKKSNSEQPEVIKKLSSDSDGKVKFEFEYIPTTTNKIFYFEVFKEIDGEEVLVSIRRTKLEIKDEMKDEDEVEVEVEDKAKNEGNYELVIELKQ